MISTPKETEIQVIESKANDIVGRANALTVTSKKEYDGCAEFLRAIKGLKKEIDETFDESIKKAHEAHKAIVAAKKSHYDPLDSAERIIKQKSLTWYQEEQRKAQEEQRRLDEQARKAEEKRKAELEAQAKAWEEKGNTEKAEERRQAAEEVFVPAPVVNRVEKADGQAIVTTWRAEVTDLFALCNAIARGELPETVVAPVMKELNALARTWKGTKKFDGVRFVKEETMSVRS